MRLLQDALQLKIHLQATDNLPSNGVLPVKRRSTQYPYHRKIEAANTTFDVGFDSASESKQHPQTSMKRLIVSKQRLMSESHTNIP